MTETTRRVPTCAGPVIGTIEDGLSVFRGIPYAAAPFGENRFRAPRPPAPWTDPFEAFTFGATSPQVTHAAAGGLPDVPEPIIPGKDILNLNIWTAELDPSEPRPVLVWIHGGGFYAGCSANPWYDGASFAGQGLVFVSINYRLGAEGFLECEGADTNRGLLDWLAALNWVRENIAAFGGNPADVTVMGQSAGGIAVGALLSAPRAAGLFRRAIIASGVLDASRTRTLAESGELTEELARITGAAPHRESMLRVPPDTLAREHFQLISKSVRGGAPTSSFSWTPVIDGDLIPRSLTQAVRTGMTSAVPMLLGTTENESTWGSLRKGHYTDEGFRRGQEVTDRRFRRPTDELARDRVGQGGAPTFRYEFQWKSAAERYILSAHSLDIPFFFNTLDAPYVAEFTGPNPPRSVARLMHEGFARFAKTGDPGWPPFDDFDSVMLMDTKPRLAAGVTF
ncbi:carboxylesterase/lipase family protein [Nakamurella alba]|nr:carboxylesterase family protein [Nakamurella alba]